MLKQWLKYPTAHFIRDTRVTFSIVTEAFFLLLSLQ